MSCNWDVYCVDCDEHVGMSVNHGEEFVRVLVRRREIFESLGLAFEEEKFLLWDPIIKMGGVYVDVDFFVKHRGHVLRPRNEYGEFDGMCKANFKCSSCGPVTCDRKDHSMAHNPLHGHTTEDHVYHYQGNP